MTKLEIPATGASIDVSNLQIHTRESVSQSETCAREERGGSGGWEGICGMAVMAVMHVLSHNTQGLASATFYDDGERYLKLSVAIQLDMPCQM